MKVRWLSNYQHQIRNPQQSKFITPNRTIPSDVKMYVWRRDGGRCVECGSTDDLVFEHITPISQGGGNTPDNLRLVCRDCIDEKQRTAAARIAAYRKQTAQQYTPSERNIPPEVKQAVYIRTSPSMTGRVHFEIIYPFQARQRGTKTGILGSCAVTMFRL